MCTKITSEMHISHGVVCYKVVKLPFKSTLKDVFLHKLHLKKRYKTCFYNSVVEIGKEYVGSPTLTKQLIEENVRIGHSVGGGFIHSFRSKEDAIAVAKSWGYLCPAVIKCIIPDETPYFEGLWESSMVCDCYVSTNIKYVKRVY